MSRGSPFLGHQPSPVTANDLQEQMLNDGWWPDINMQKLKATARVASGTTNERLVKSTKDAVMDVNNELKAWRAEQQAAGFKSLKNVPAESVDNNSVLVEQYLRAIYHTVDADLAEQYRNYDTTGAGDRRAEVLEERADTARRNKRWAISLILGHESSTPVAKLKVYVI